MAESKRSILYIVDITILVVIGTACGYSVVSNLFFPTPGESFNYSQYVVFVLLGIIPHFIIHSFIELKMEQERDLIHNKFDSLPGIMVGSLNGVEKKTFSDIDKVNLYVAERIKSASSSVRDLNWQDYRVPTQRNIAKVENGTVDIAIRTFCKKKEKNSDAIYQEIFTFPKSNHVNLGKLQEHLTYGTVYSCSFYDYSDPDIESGKFPKIQFVIIDDEEVIFVSSEYNGHHCAVKDKKIVYICRNYFEQAWTLSKLIKDKNDEPNLDLIHLIKNRYSDR